ncbi:aldo/keto reductase [Marinimicrobium locisalis]|uniref:aldo/keto reductase n=1 Tax=Marinimicrobium locisalis TaxID=546022 RepID=UPI0032221856
MTLPRSQQRRPLGDTPLELPLLGFGSAPLGNLYRPLSEDQARATLIQARADGISYFDTAPHYGFGLSEQRLGAVLARESCTLSSKVGRRLEPIASDGRAETRFGFVRAPDLTPVFDYSYEGVMAQLEESRLRLGRRPAIVYAHDLGPLTHGERDRFYWDQFCQGGYRALRECKQRGLIHAIGLGVNETAVCERALNELDIDVLLLAGRYTLLEQAALERLLPACLAKGVPVVIGGAFNSGILASGVGGSGPFRYNYESAPVSIIERVAALEVVCADFGVPLPAAALQFPTAHPAVVSVIAGCAHPEEVHQAKVWMDAPIPPAFWDALKEQQLLAGDAPVPA